MSRDICFRAWDKVAKKFLIPWPDGFHILGETTCFDMIGMQLSERNPEKTTLEKLNDVIIEQYTGLSDKSGKEIWEGDKARATVFIEEDTPPFAITGQVKYYNGGFCIEAATIYYRLSDLADIEVIGDIHTTPLEKQ